MKRNLIDLIEKIQGNYLRWVEEVEELGPDSNLLDCYMTKIQCCDLHLKILETDESDT